MKKIIITDLTKKSKEYVCLAGINIETGETIRVNQENITTDFIIKKEIKEGSILEGDFHSQNGVSPHTEDYFYNGEITNLGEDYSKLLEVLEETYISDLKKIWNGNMDYYKKKFCASNFISTSSLLTLKISSLKIFYDLHNRLRARFNDSFQEFNYVAINSFNLLNNSSFNLNEINTTVNDSKFIYLRLGLTREHKGFYWLQVNAIYLVNDNTIKIL